MKNTKKITQALTNAAILTMGSIAAQYAATMDFIPESVRPFTGMALGVGLQMQRNPMLATLGQGMIVGSVPPALAALGIEIPQIAGAPPVTPVLGVPASRLTVLDSDNFSASLFNSDSPPMPMPNNAGIGQVFGNTL